LTPGARFEWGRVVPRAVRAGLVRDVDLPAYGLACEALAEVRRLGTLIEIESGTKTFNPRTRRAFVAASNVARRILADLNLTPKSRQGRITVEVARPPRNETVFAALRRGKRPILGADPRQIGTTPTKGRK
jgi:phage terminase small subunit